MWRLDEIDVQIDEVEGSEIIISIVTPACSIEIIGNVSVVGRVLRVERAHVQGATAGALGRAGLNAIGRKLLAEADADRIVVEGSARATGATIGRVPRPIRFPR